VFKGRFWLFVVIAIGAVLLFLLCRTTSLWRSSTTSTSQLPVDLKNVIPTSWTLLPNQPEICDYDGDGEDEWLILFRYDTTTVQVPYQPPGTTTQEGPIGGVIYDAQVNYPPQDLGNTSPYRPALLLPYMLLPDYFPGKGQGYLGESNVTLAQYPAASSKSGECVASELYVLGFVNGSLPQRLSAFRWAGKSTGYAVAHFVGDARIAADLSPDDSKPLSRVTIYNRLNNHRSLLCEVKSYVRQGEPADLSFPEDPNAYTIDFCFNAPNDPFYPEGVVVALLRGNSPANTNMPPPMGDSYLMPGVPLPAELGDPTETPLRILTVVNQGAARTVPGNAQPCPQQPVPTPPNSVWWCGADKAEVLTEVVLGQSQTQRVLWTLVSVANEQVNAETYWRISDARLQ
jgi:hypothetical protein